MAIEHPQVIGYLDNEFAKEIATNPYFNYRQIKENTQAKDLCVFFDDQYKI